MENQNFLATYQNSQNLVENGTLIDLTKVKTTDDASIALIVADNIENGVNLMKAKLLEMIKTNKWYEKYKYTKNGKQKLCGTWKDFVENVLKVSKATADNYVKVAQYINDKGDCDTLNKDFEYIENINGVEQEIKGTFGNIPYTYTKLCAIVYGTKGEKSDIDHLTKNRIISPLMSVSEIKKEIKEYYDEKNGKLVKEDTPTDTPTDTPMDILTMIENLENAFKEKHGKKLPQTLANHIKALKEYA